MVWTSMRGGRGGTDALYDGVPSWMSSSLYRWIDDMTEMLSPHFSGGRAGLVSRFDNLTKSLKPLASGVSNSYVSSPLRTRADDDLTLDYTDFLIMSLQERDSFVSVVPLMRLLDEGGSAWQVGQRGEFSGLVRRVPEAAQAAAQAAFATPGHAGPLLAEAWTAIYGRGPDYEKGYAKAVKAVEAASVPMVSATNSAATLGTVIADLRNQKDWRLEMSRDVSAPSQQLIIDMATRLWTGQNDRHAGQVGYKSSTKADAEAAVLLAVPLVLWFSSGAIARRP